MSWFLSPSWYRAEREYMTPPEPHGVLCYCDECVDDGDDD